MGAQWKQAGREANTQKKGQMVNKLVRENKDLDQVSKALKSAGWTIISAEIRYVAKTFTDLSDAARKEVADFLNALDDHDDVHRVYAEMR